jgi:DNA-binding CsgD family transcriptional regulator
MTSSKTISDILFRIYEAKPDKCFFKHLLRVLEDYIPAAVTGYTTTNLDTRQFNLKEMHSLQGIKLPSVEDMDMHVTHHPFLEYFMQNNAGPVLCSSDIMSDEEWKATKVYQLFHRRLGVFYDHTVRFYSGSECLSFMFADTVPMNMDHRRLLTLVAPHLGNAYKVHRQQQNHLLRSIPESMLLLDKAGYVLQCGEGSESLLKKYFPAEEPWPIQGIPQPVIAWVCTVSEQQEPKTTGTSGVHGKLYARRNSFSLMMRMHQSEDGWLITMEETRFIRIIDVLLGFGLTPREAEVMIWVTQGKQNGEVATILDIRLATVRKHMEHILQKLQCESRGVAVQLVMSSISEKLPHAKCYHCIRVACKNCHT